LIFSGLGVDSHRFAPGRPLILGGIDIPHEEGLDGHSDADVLTHAIIDALLGAAGMGDIGQHFPDTDPQFKDASSMQLLQAVVIAVEENGFRIVNVDATVQLERPKLAPYREAIREALSAVLKTARVNVKATTGEGMGFVGRGEGAAAMAIATLDRPEVSRR
jgi:2-C-methyl-D-erythritol 2,4-cyclodiphosphate synthase